MRHGARFLMATALVLPLGFVASAPGAGAAAGTNCAHSSGTANFTPKSGDCVSTDLASVTFAEVSHLVIH